MRPFTLAALLVLVILSPDCVQAQSPSNLGVRQTAFEA
jgi:hypothetical protein